MSLDQTVGRSGKHRPEAMATGMIFDAAIMAALTALDGWLLSGKTVQSRSINSPFGRQNVGLTTLVKHLNRIFEGFAIQRAPGVFEREHQRPIDPFL